MTRNKCDKQHEDKIRENVKNRLAEVQKGEFVDIGFETTLRPENEELEEHRFDYLYFEVSAMTGENLDAAILNISKEVMKTKANKKAEAKKERDFGTTLVFTDSKKDIKTQNKSECCS